MSFLGDNSCSFATSESLSTPQKSLLCHPMLCDTKTRRPKDMNKFCFSFYCIYLFACLCTSVHTCMPSIQVQLSGQHLEVCPLLLPNGSREIKHQINTPGIFYLLFLHHFLLLYSGLCYLTTFSLIEKRVSRTNSRTGRFLKLPSAPAYGTDCAHLDEGCYNNCH